MQSEERPLIEVNSLMFSPGQEESCAPTKDPVKYGELVVLGWVCLYLIVSPQIHSRRNFKLSVRRYVEEISGSQLTV